MFSFSIFSFQQRSMKYFDGENTKQSSCRPSQVNFFPSLLCYEEILSFKYLLLLLPAINIDIGYIFFRFLYARNSNIFYCVSSSHNFDKLFFFDTESIVHRRNLSSQKLDMIDGAEKIWNISEVECGGKARFNFFPTGKPVEIFSRFNQFRQHSTRQIHVTNKLIIFFLSSFIIYFIC